MKSVKNFQLLWNNNFIKKHSFYSFFVTFKLKSYQIIFYWEFFISDSYSETVENVNNVSILSVIHFFSSKVLVYSRLLKSLKNTSRWFSFRIYFESLPGKLDSDRPEIKARGKAFGLFLFCFCILRMSATSIGYRIPNFSHFDLKL